MKIVNFIGSIDSMVLFWYVIIFFFIVLFIGRIIEDVWEEYKERNTPLEKRIIDELKRMWGDDVSR